jgi:O-acetylserine/cysteine efflux transporter
MNEIILLSFVTLGWTISPFIRKYLVNNEYDLSHFIFWNTIIVLICATLYIFFTNNYNLNVFNWVTSLNTIEIILLIISGLTTFFAVISYTSLVEKLDITYIYPIVLLVPLTLSVIIGFLLKEKINFEKILAIIIIVIGMIFLTYGQYKD